QNVYGVLGVVGTPTAEEAMKIAINESIPFLMPLTGAEFLYDANHLTFTLRQSYKQEAATMVKYMLAHDIKKVAIVYQNDSFGLTALNAFSKSIAGSGIKLVTEGVYNRNTLSINYALGEIIKYSPQAVIIAGTQKPTVELIKRAEDNKLEALFFNFSFGGYEPIYEEARKKRVNLNKIFITQVVPPLMTNENEDTRAFKTLYAKYYPSSKPNSIAFEGFLAAKTVVSALAKARNSRSDFIKSLSSMQIELAGKKLLYAENDHGGLKDTYLLKLGENGGILVNE
ncbi:MAG TPA: ABC transporter substrate-binding protein, partial [Campylobacterales bacterium]|nr:ABC transporter substrate-binding protein [Campylobacterales bacterium]